MNAPTTAVSKRDDKAMEYIPFGSQDKIRLTIEIVKATIAIPTKSGKLPQDRDIIKFMMMCSAQRLNPYAGDAYLTGYDTSDGPKFSLITAQQALLKRAEVSEHFKGMLSGIIIKEGEEVKEVEGDFYLPGQEVIGGWAKVYHEKRAHPFYRRIRLERFNTGYAQWKVDAAGMICKCAEADALRSAFPTMLGGLYIAEEQTIPVDITATVTKTVGPPAEPKPALAAPAEPTLKPQEELAAVITEPGFTFTEFQQWADATGQLPKADTLASFDEISEADAKRLLRAKSGILDALQAAKGGV
jgi:phage recombination protein Bet